MDQKKQSSEGDPMFVESLMTAEEWAERLKKYPTSNKKYDEVNKNKTNPFKWRYRMGDYLTEQQIKLVNGRIDAWMRVAKESKKNEAN